MDIPTSFVVAHGQECETFRAGFEVLGQHERQPCVRLTWPLNSESQPLYRNLGRLPPRTVPGSGSRIPSQAVASRIPLRGPNRKYLVSEADEYRTGSDDVEGLKAPLDDENSEFGAISSRQARGYS
jgi:hypothetical protein